MAVTRNPFLLGHDQLDFTHQPGDMIDTTKPLLAAVSLDGVPLAELIAYPVTPAPEPVEGSRVVYTFYDLQDLLPDFTLPLPRFTDLSIPVVDMMRELTLEYRQRDSYYQKESRPVLLNAGRSLSLSKGRPYSDRLPIPFLTNQPQAKEVTLFSTEWLFLPLSFLPYFPGWWWELPNPMEMPSQLRVRATAVNAAGATTVVAISTETDHVNNSLQAFDFSPYRIMPLLPVDTVGYYIQITDEFEQILSERRYFHLVDSREDDIHLVFENSLGCWDTVWFRNNQTRGFKVEKSLQKYRRELSVEEVSNYRTITIRATNLNQRWQLYMPELLQSRKVYLREGNVYHALICETDTLDYLDTSKYTENMEITFRFADTSRSL